MAKKKAPSPNAPATVLQEMKEMYVKLAGQITEMRVELAELRDLRAEGIERGNTAERATPNAMTEETTPKSPVKTRPVESLWEAKETRKGRRNLLTGNSFAALEGDDEYDEIDEEIAKPDVRTQVAKVENPNGRQYKRTEFRGLLPQVTGEGSKEAVQIMQLIAAIEASREDYTDRALAMGMRARLKPETLAGLDPNNTLDLDGLIDGLKRRFNSSERLNEEVNRVVDFKIKKSGDRIEEVQRYLDQTALLNARCMQAGVPGHRWTNARMMDHLIKQVLKDEGEFTKELNRRWSEVDMQKTEEMTLEKIRNMIAGAHQHAQMFEDCEKEGRLNVFSNGSIGARSSPIKRNCWRCGKEFDTTSGRFMGCQCGEKPSCAVCHGNHKTEFHAEVTSLRQGSGARGFKPRATRSA